MSTIGLRAFYSVASVIALLGGAASSFAADSHAKSVALFGPETFTRPEGAPVTQTVTFNADPTVPGPYTLVVVAHGKVRGYIGLNGQTVYGPHDKKKRQSVTLQASNTLQVVLDRKGKETIEVSILGYQYEFASDYEDLAPYESLITVRDINWVTKGYVTPVQDQGKCQADWAFSATGAVESLNALKTGGLINLSEQALLDCPLPQISSCADSSPAAALQFLIDGGGLPTDQAYPYTARVGTCQPYTPAVRLDGMKRIAPGDETELINALNNSPVSVVLDGGWLDSYVTGVADPPCGDTPPRFVAALVVGYEGSNYLVKTSRGPSFGMSGYFKLPIGANKCGIANFAVIAQ